MKNNSMLTPFFFIFFLFFIFHHITVATSTPPYIAVDNITLDCGSFDNSKATDERDWIGDRGSKYGPMEQNNESNSSKAQSQASSVESIPYSTARLSYSQFTYVFLKTSLKSRISITENSRRRNREKKEKQRERIVGKILQKLSH